MLKYFFSRYLFACLCISTITKAQLSSVTSLPAHPRLLLLKGEEQLVQKTIASDKIWRSVHLAILGECDSLENIPPV